MAPVLETQNRPIFKGYQQENKINKVQNTQKEATQRFKYFHQNNER